jgi:pimeloyl-ACP methyl ester carboxylesterase
MPCFELADGRTLEYLVAGPADGIPLILHSGTPSAAVLFEPMVESAARHGLRIVVHSRPGYAGSSPRPGRTVASVAADVAALADVLNAGRFLTVGWSGGGPHALACSARLGSRCRAAATLAGVGAYGVTDLDFLAGMGPENHAEFGAALRGERDLRAWLDANAEPLRSVSGAELADAFGGLVPQADKDALAGGFADSMAATMRRALAGGFDGWIDDDLAFVQPWGFDLAAIAVPVAIWQGDLDLMVPFAHGAWLRRHLPGATSHAAPGHGHITLITAYRNAIVDDLLATAARA